jgi:capsular polysaccharide biosynthesis protein
MENLQYSKILRANWDIVALIIGITVVLSLIISLVQPFQYSASTKILVIQKQEINTDAYTATKSAERIGKNLANIIFTSSFYNEVIESNSNFKDKFSADSIERRKQWEKNIKTSVTPETGILEIDVFDVDRNFASQLVKTITYVLVNKGAEYHGGGSNVEIKIVDDVFISRYPVRPNIILNSVLALIIGFLFGSALVILNESKKLKMVADLNAGFEENSAEYLDNYNQTAEADWQVIKASKDKDFGFVPEVEMVEEEVKNSGRKTEIKTMYDHLK